MAQGSDDFGGYSGAVGAGRDEEPLGGEEAAQRAVVD